MNLLHHFETAFRKAGQGAALLCPDSDDMSYAQLDAAVQRMAGALLARGVGVASERPWTIMPSRAVISAKSPCAHAPGNLSK